jgi:hypothetical protein
MARPMISMRTRIRSTSGDLALIHNGIIENYAAIKEELGIAGTSSRATPIPRCWCI